MSAPRALSPRGSAPDLGVGSWPHRRARIDPDRTALVQGHRSRTYRELADRVDALAAALAARGVRPDERVAYLGANDVAAFEAGFATWRLGATFAPLNTRLVTAELAYLIEDCAPVALCYGPEQAGAVAALRSGRSAVRHWVRAGGESGGDIGADTGSDEDLDGLVAAGGEVPRTQVGLADDAVILYTSGTTGHPKGAVLTHGNLTFNTMNQLAHVDVLGSDTALCIAPLFHATGLGQVSLPTLFKGGRVVVVPKFDAAGVLSAIGALRIASFSAVPTMLQMLCEHPDFAGADLSSLRYVIYGGSMVAERVALAWQRQGVELLQGYGMTEAAPGVTMATVDGARRQPVSVGVPHFFTDIALTGDGELLVRGPNVFRGYWNRPDDTERALAGGWFRSGDVVSVGEDGWVHVVDRINDMIISGGENVYPAEVETALAALPGVLESAVVATADERWGEVGTAFVVTAPGSAWTGHGLRAALAESLAAFKIPKYVRFVGELPKTATGKIRRHDLRARTAKETGDDDDR